MAFTLSELEENVIKQFVNCSLSLSFFLASILFTHCRLISFLLAADTQLQGTPKQNGNHIHFYLLSIIYLQLFSFLPPSFFCPLLLLLFSLFFRAFDGLPMRQHSSFSSSSCSLIPSNELGSVAFWRNCKAINISAQFNSLLLFSLSKFALFKERPHSIVQRVAIF